MDPCAPLASTGVDGGVAVVAALVAVALLVGGVLLVRRTRGGPTTTALLVALAVVAVGFAVTTGGGAAHAAAPTVTCPPTSAASTAPSTPATAVPTTADPTARPTTSATGAPTTPPIEPTQVPTQPTTVPVETGEVRITWPAIVDECGWNEPNPNTVLLVDDAARVVVWAGPMDADGGDRTVADLVIPGTYRVIVTADGSGAYPDDGTFAAPAAFQRCLGVETPTYLPDSPAGQPVGLDASSPAAVVALTVTETPGCPSSDKSNSLDTDGDGTRDVCDLDSDDDGVPDAAEDANANGRFQDDDWEGDARFVDVLGDGVPEYRDLDSDNDGVLDLFESGVPADVLDAIDRDADGVIDADVARGANGFADVLETGPDSGVAAWPLRDRDGDGIPDVRDLVSDATQFDLYAIGRSDLDDVGGGFLSRTRDDDQDGIQDGADTAAFVRGAPGSPRPPLGP